MTALFICGPAGAGKDTVGDCLKAAGWRAESTSRWYLDNRHIPSSPIDRVYFESMYGSHWREALADFIARHNQSDGTNCRLYREMVGAGCQAVNGVRRLAELKACIDAGLVREIWWIDAAKRLEGKPPDTTLDYGLAEVEGLGVPFKVLNSNGTVEELINNVQEVLSDGT